MVLLDKDKDKVDKPLTRLIKKKRERTQVNKIKIERIEIIANITQIQRIFRNYCDQLSSKKFDNVGEMDKFLETYSLPKLNQEEVE